MNNIETIELYVGHVVDVEVTTLIENAITIAKEQRSHGGSKIDCVRKIYPAIKHCPKQAIWYAIIQGVSISSRGAVTYYYNMKKENQ